MSSCSTAARIPRHRALSVSLAIGLGISLCAVANAGTIADSQPAKKPAHANAKQQPRPNTPHTVDTCADDDSPGSLRAIIASPNTAPGDTIDLSQLPMGCSVITLDGVLHVPAHITINQASLSLIGPANGQLTIRGNFQSSVIRHMGYQTLDIEGIKIEDGKYSTNNLSMGGCIYSKGSVTLKNAHVDNCTAAGTGAADALGGGVFVKHDLTLDHSVISDGYADGQGAGARARGGGAYVNGNLHATYSTISANKAIGHSFGSGGGAYVLGDSQIQSSTVSANHAEIDGGLVLNTAAIVDSTISGNEAASIGGGVYASGNLSVTNSTVVFNRDHGTPDSYGGITAGGSALILVSSIVADNSGFDVWAQPATTTSGSNNLIVSSHGVPSLPLTVTACPRLDVLADNGGATLTHALSPASPAIDVGDAGTLVFDQTGHTRTVGIAADIGAFEWRDTPTDRILTSLFEKSCDD